MPFHTYFLACSAAASLAGCATRPSVALSANHPASPSAPEAATPRARAALQPDANTLRTRELLAARAQEAKAAEEEKPIDQSLPPVTAPRTAPGPLDDAEMKGSKMKGMNMDGMKGMNHENH